MEPPTPPRGPFAGAVEGERLIGRGATDMKGPIAAVPARLFVDFLGA